MRTEIVANIAFKILFMGIAWYFYTVGNLFIAGLFMGWIVFEVLTLLWIIVATIIIVSRGYL